VAGTTEVSELILQGIPPDIIAGKLGRDQQSIHYTVFKAVGRGLITFTDVYFSLQQPDSPESTVERLLATLLGNEHATLDGEWAQRYERFAIAEHALQIREIEQALHREFQISLKAHFGDEEREWWRLGIPNSVRKKCVAMREEDHNGANHEPYEYTMLIDLQTIAKKQWMILNESVGFLDKFKQQDFFDDVERLNRIRNLVMHPVRIHIPNNEDIRFVEEFHRKINQ